MMEFSKGDTVCVVKEIKEQISPLKEKADRAEAKHLKDVYNLPTFGTS
jgi:hypothetical protein